MVAFKYLVWPLLGTLVTALPSNLVPREALIPPPEPVDLTPACWKNLSCSFHEIEDMNMDTRLEFVRYMEAVHFDKLNSANQFRPIEGVITFFIDENLGSPGSWVSYVDAGIVEAIQRGGAIALDLGSFDGGNPGSPKWNTFLTEMKNGELDDRNDHDYTWSIAEQTATEYGKTSAETTSMVGRPTKQQLRWYQFTQLFRAIMRNRKKIILAIRVLFALTNPPLALAAEAFIDWLTDTTNIKPTQIGCKIAWGLSEFDVPLGANLIDDAKLLKALLPKLYDAYKDSK
ncbi:MAG: hypothetical protein Q9214_001451 [Letrouitia sp. 1 TL-2023]